MATSRRAALGQLRRGNLRLTDLHRSRAAVAGYTALRRGFERIGLQVVAKGFYSPIPDLSKVSESTWSRRSALPGIDFRLEPQLELLEGALARFIYEFDGGYPF